MTNASYNNTDLSHHTAKPATQITILVGCSLRTPRNFAVFFPTDH